MHSLTKQFPRTIIILNENVNIQVQNVNKFPGVHKQHRGDIRSQG